MCLNHSSDPKMPFLARRGTLSSFLPSYNVNHLTTLHLCPIRIRTCLQDQRTSSDPGPMARDLRIPTPGTCHHRQRRCFPCIPPQRKRAFRKQSGRWRTEPPNPRDPRNAGERLSHIVVGMGRLARANPRLPARPQRAVPRSENPQSKKTQS